MWLAEVTVMWMVIFGQLPREAFFETLKNKTPPHYYIQNWVQGAHKTVSMGWLRTEQELRPHNKIFQGGGGGRNLYWFSLGLKKVGNNLTNYWNFFSWRRNWKPSQSYLFCASSFVLPLEWIAIERPVSDILIFLDLLFLHENKYSHAINV